MGGTESRFNSLLLEGSDEEQPLKMWLQDKELQDSFQQHPNLPLKGSPYRDTPLHCAARKQMKILMLEFLDKGADPLARNSNSETPMHIVCTSARASSRTSKRRYDILQLLLDRIPEICGEESYDVIRSDSSPCVEESGIQNGVPYSANVNLGIKDKVQDKWGIVKAEAILVSYLVASFPGLHPQLNYVASTVAVPVQATIAGVEGLGTRLHTWVKLSL